MKIGIKKGLLAVGVCLGWTVNVVAAEYVKVDGSSTVYPITEAVAEEFQMRHRDVRVTVGISGTGGGFKKFCRGEIDVTNASRPIKPSEVEICKANGVEYIELPVAYDGLAVLINPQNDWVDYLTVGELKKIWEPSAQGVITRWNQIRPEWPDAPIQLFGPGVDSGTFDYFTAAIVGEEGASRGDFTSSEDDNVLVYGIAGNKYALGYFGLAYYEENKDKLKVVPIDNEDGRGPILPSLETVKNGTYQPLSRPLFIYVNKKSLETKPWVKDFVMFYLDHAPELAKEVGYIPLPDEIIQLAKKRVEEKVTGSIFEGKGSTVGVSLKDLMSLE